MNIGDPGTRVKLQIKDGGTLPEPSDSVIERGVIAEDRDVLRLGLCDQHTIKRILVWSRQQPRTDSVIGGNSKRFKTFPGHVAGKVCQQIAASGNFPIRNFVAIPGLKLSLQGQYSLLVQGASSPTRARRDRPSATREARAYRSVNA